MIFALDHLIFGNGFGDAAPYHDQRYFWLVDTLRKERNGRNGELYQWQGWFGAQLISRQWTHPRAGERRRLSGYEFVVFHSTRRWLRVEVAWALAALPKDLNAANAMLHEVETKLVRA
jgi:hypothetical protein